MTIWQQAAGDKDRNYSDICLEWDVILNGPGYAGPWPECKSKLKSDNWSDRKIRDLKRFCEEMKEGDIVVLRLGTNEAVGVGKIVGEYEWSELFSDIDGWNLQHVRRVKWYWKGSKSFDTYTLKQGDTTQRLDSQEVIDWIEKEIKFDQDNTINQLPTVENCDIDIESVFEYLFDQGVSANSIEILRKEIDDLIRIAKWYVKYGRPSEHETNAYLVIPLLRAIGWTPQKMAIEWNNIDIALFNKLPRKDENLTAVVETKRKDNSCLTAKSQAEEYAKDKPNCKRLIVTDGIRYGVYLKENDTFNLYAYMNLTRIKDEYPIYNCKGIRHVLRAMSPEWDHQELLMKHDEE